MSAPSGVFVVLHPIYYFINSFGLAVTGLPTASRLHSRNDIWHESWYLAAWRTHKLPVSTGSDFCIRDSLLFLTADGKSSGADEPKRLSNFFRISVKRRPGLDSSYSVLYSLAVPSREEAEQFVLFSLSAAGCLTCLRVWQICAGMPFSWIYNHIVDPWPWIYSMLHIGRCCERVLCYQTSC